MDDDEGLRDPRVRDALRLHEAGDFLAAADAYAAILGDHPRVSEFWRRIAMDALAKDRPDDAESLLRRTLERTPGDAETLHALAQACRARGNLADALGACRRALEARPEDAAGHVHLAEILLAGGDWPAGFAAFEWRLKVPGIALPQPPPGLPQWRGEDLDGKRLLVAAEQGFGDTLQFCRFVAEPVRRGAHVVLAVPPPLHDLCMRLEGVARVVCRDDDLPACDFWLPMGSLAHRFGLTPEAFPPPYLPASPSESGGGFTVGVAWRGRPGSTDRKSVPLDFLRRLVDVPGLSFVGLQFDASPEAGAVLPNAVAGTDFAGTADVIAGLDLVIAADTVVAHLAGAVGRPLWVLLAHNPNWRWLQAGAESPWYPTARLFRQSAPGDWESVINAVREALEARTG